MELPETFFTQSAPKLAVSLLGKKIVHGNASGIIVETEAYTQQDAASHSFNGLTPRNAVMFGPGGYAYIYFTYGMHYCFNVVSGSEGSGEAVLIRAVEPLSGLDAMRQRRGRDTIHELCSGPAKFVQAFGITKQDNGKLLRGGSLRIEETGSVPETVSGPRIGIVKAVDTQWRFWIKDSPFTSRV